MSPLSAAARWETLRRRWKKYFRPLAALRALRKWLTPGIGVKRWLLLLGFGVTVISLGVAQFIVEIYRGEPYPSFVNLVTLRFLPPVLRVLFGLGLGVLAIVVAIVELNRSILAPFAGRAGPSLIDAIQAYNRQQKGIRLVAIGGGTGLPSVLRGLKAQTSNVTAIVTVADDGGSSGKLRRELGVLPPGDLRNNIAALANDEHLMTQLFQYRFEAGGGLEGHSFGNLFLTALAEITGSMDQAIIEASRVLNIQGQVLPSTLQDVVLCAELREEGRLRRVQGESNITAAGGRIERVFLEPGFVRAYPDSIRAILNAGLIVVGPGSLYTSILPNLLVEGVPEAIRASSALCVYVCNIATQQGETNGFDVADHVLAIERHIGQGVIDIVLANNVQPTQNAGERTVYVPLCPPDHPIRRRYRVIETDLTDTNRPWRHSPAKLGRVLQDIVTSAALPAG